MLHNHSVFKNTIIIIILTLIFGILIHEHVEMVVAVPRSHFAFVRSPEKHQGRPGGPNSV